MPETLSLLISSLDDGIFRCKNFLNIEVDEIILVHQITQVEKKDLYLQFYTELESGHLKIFTCYEKGLSKSRNICLKNATSDLLLICDDDGKYQIDLKKKIISSIKEFPEIDIFTFKIKGDYNLAFKSYQNLTFRHTKWSAAKVSSIEMLIRKNWLQSAQVQFDEQFGLGTSLPSGEEFIFLTDALKKHAQLQFIPENIVIHQQLSSGKIYTPELIRSKGAMFKRTFGFWSVFYNFLFAIKKYPEYRTSFSFFHFLKQIYSGSNYKMK